MIFSVVIPVYNVKDYLPKCIDSVLAQDFDDYEIVLVDDGSTDGESGAICDRYAEANAAHIRVIHKPNGGLGDARNVGMEAAQGEYVVFLDSDDYVDAGMLSALAAVIDRFHCDVIDFGLAVVHDGKVTKQLVNDLPHECAFTLDEVPQLLFALPNACMRCWKRSLFLDTGIRYPARVWYEDIRTTLKLFAAAKSICAIPDTFYYYVQREGSIMHTPNVKRNAEILDAFDDLLGWFRENGLFERYYNELSRLAVDHVLLAASVRVACIDPANELLGQFSDYVNTQFPDWRGNPYLQQLPRRHRLLVSLLLKKRYGTVRALFRLKQKLS